MDNQEFSNSQNNIAVQGNNQYSAQRNFSKPLTKGAIYGPISVLLLLVWNSFAFPFIQRKVLVLFDNANFMMFALSAVQEIISIIFIVGLFFVFFGKYNSKERFCAVAILFVPSLSNLLYSVIINAFESIFFWLDKNTSIDLYIAGYIVYFVIIIFIIALTVASFFVCNIILTKSEELLKAKNPDFNQSAQKQPQPEYIPNNNISATPEMNSEQNMPSEKSKGVAALLCFFLGEFGIHRFYAGKIGTGLLWMFTGGLFLIGSFVDFFMIIFGSFKDGNGRTIK